MGLKAMQKLQAMICMSIIQTGRRATKLQMQRWWYLQGHTLTSKRCLSYDSHLARLCLWTWRCVWGLDIASLSSTCWSSGICGGLGMSQTVATSAPWDSLYLQFQYNTTLYWLLLCGSRECPDFLFALHGFRFGVTSITCVHISNHANC